MSVATIEGAGFGDWDRVAAEWKLLNELNEAARATSGSTGDKGSLGYGEAPLLDVDPFAGERLAYPEVPTPYLDLGAAAVLPQVTDQTIREFFERPF